MKIAIEEIAEYLRAWPLGDDWYIEDEENPGLWETELDLENDYKVRNPGTIVTLDRFEAGLQWQGERGEDPTHGDGKSLVKEIKKYLKSKSTVTMVFSVPKEHEEAFARAIESLGAKRLK